MEMYYLKQSFENIRRALDVGANCKPIEWHDALKTKLIDSLYNYFSSISSNSYEQQIEKLHSLIKFPPENGQTLIHYLICQLHHNRSIVELTNENYLLSSQLIKECNFHLRECERLIEKNEFCEWVSVKFFFVLKLLINFI